MKHFEQSQEFGNPIDGRLGASAKLDAPWRMEYLAGIAEGDRKAGAGGVESGKGEEFGTFIGRYWANGQHDAQNHVIVRTGEGMIFLNAYPYSNGHLLVALGDGRGRLHDYSAAQREGLWSLVDVAVELCELALMPQGVNVGVNQGRAAGAGVPGHLHVHVVPRWSGDTNFISTVARVRVIPASLEVMYGRYVATARAMGLVKD